MWTDQFARRKKYARRRSPQARAMHFELCENRELLATLSGYSAAFDDLATFGEIEYVTLPDSNPLVGATEFTIEAWVRRENVDLATNPGDAVLTSGDQSEFWFGVLGNRAYLRTGLNRSSVTGNSVLDNHAWTHIAVTSSSSEGIKLYVNGQLDALLASPTTPPQWNAKWHIGAAPVDQISVDDQFAGNISELRLWNTARAHDDILRTMHQVMEEPQTGLIAAFPLEQNLVDTVTGAAGTPIGDIAFSNSHPSPAQHRVSKIDEFFATLRQPLYAAATVFLPQANQAILIGGREGGQPTSTIRRMDVGTGQMSVVGNLPVALAFASAVYVPSIDRIFVMGGAGAGVSSRDTTYLVNPHTGDISQGPNLPMAIQDAAAVYHPTQNKIFLLGGYPQSTAAPTNRVQVVDPTTNTAEFANFSLPIALAGSAAIIASSTGDIYYFGGAKLSLAGQVGSPAQAHSNQTYRIRFNNNIADVRTIPSALLPYNDMGQAAVEDPRTRMIYLLGGLYNDRVLAFDPSNERLWETAFQIIKPSANGTALRHASVVFSPANSHALVIGGHRALLAGQGTTEVRRVSLGLGPAVALERWDVGELSNGVTVTGESIAGDDTIVAIASRTNGITRLAATPNNGVVSAQFTNAQLGGVPGVPAVDGERQLIVVPIGDGTGNQYRGARLIQGNTITTIDANTPGFGTNDVFSTYIAPDGTIFFNTRLGLRWKPPGTSSTIVTTTSECRNNLTSRGVANEVWGTTVLGGGEFRTFALCRMIYGPSGLVRDDFFAWPGTATIPFRFMADFKFDRLQNFWLADGQENKVWFIQAGDTPNFQLAQPIETLLGTPLDEGVDAEGRVWLGERASVSPLGSGGLSVFQATGPVNVRLEVRNWLNAPIGSANIVRQFNNGSFRPTDLFTSDVTSVEGVGERTWMVTAAAGRTMSIAQRWQQLDETNRLDQRVVDRIWAARGRIFLATRNSAGTDPVLSVLQPDGLTWDNRSGVTVRSLFQDSRGNVWIGTTSGVRLYNPAGGWDLLSDRLGRAPVGEVRGIAEDNIGRVWIASDSGLTLFDRNRFVTTLTSQNSQLPNTVLRSLYHDGANQLWIATDAGLVVMRNGTFQRYTTANGLPSNQIREVVESGIGEIFVSTQGGLAKFQNGIFVSQSLPNGISSANLPLTVDDTGQVWAGAVVLTTTGWQSYNAINSGLRSALVTDVIADGANHIWFAHGTDGGISVRGTYLPPLAETVPIIGSIEPSSGSSGDYITIRGGGLLGADMQVTIGGKQVEVDRATARDDQVRVRINNSTQSGKVILKRSGRTATSNTEFCARPTFKATNPFAPVGSGIGGEISIYGTNFDRDALVRIGGGAERTASYVSPQHIKVFVEEGDRSGVIGVNNHCQEIGASTTASFRKINAQLTAIVLNQGTPNVELVQGKATMIQNYVRADGPIGEGEVLDIDTIREIVTDRNGNVNRFEYVVNKSGVRPALVNGVPSAAERATIDNSLNISNVYFRDHGRANVRTVLLRNGRSVAEGVQVVDIAPDHQLQILLVPIMRSNATSEDLRTMRSQMSSDLSHVWSRVFPFGTANVMWADEVVHRDDTFELGSFPGLYLAAPELDRIRRRHNANPFRSDAQFVMGVVQSSLVTGSSAGFAFGADVSELINTIFLDSLDILCDLGNRAVKTLTFGLVGSDDGCHIDIPLYVGWMNAGASNPGEVLAHELGHQMGLVKPWAANGSLADNISHSVNDELPEDMECDNWDDSSFDWNRSYYAQPGVRLPLVDPIGNSEWKPNRQLGARDSSRAKSLMSYACGKTSANSFFEPEDVSQINSRLLPTIADFVQITTLEILIDNEAPVAAVEDVRPDPIAAMSPDGPARGHIGEITGQRLHVFGTLNSSNGTGDLLRVESYGDSGPVTPSFATGYWVVQLDAAGRELARTGVAPLGSGEVNPGDPPANRADYIFSATVIQHPSVARIELRHRDQLLDVFRSGNAVPVVQISQSVNGATFSTGLVTTSWTVTDADNDPLQVSIEYSRDGGVLWFPVGSAIGSGTLAIPVERLGGSQGQGRFRVVASDGLHSANATSGMFTVADQAPSLSVDTSSRDQTILEGAISFLHVSAFDPEQGELSDNSVAWTSNLDGAIGNGKTITTSSLSVGRHTIQVRAVDGTGRSREDSFQLTVVADYDFDGIVDADEEMSGLNPLSPADALLDGDGDGLSLRTERALGSNPNQADSDGDGRNDGLELSELTDVLSRDAAPARDKLSVSLREVEMTVDLGAMTPLPQIDLGVFSRSTADWQIVTDVDWLEAEHLSGTTPSSNLLRLQAYKLSDGQHVGHIQFRSTTVDASEIVPITIHVVNQMRYFDQDGNGVTDVADCNQVQSTVGTIFGSPQYDLAIDIDRDGRIETTDVGNCRLAVGSVSLDGDLNLDGRVDGADIDILYREIRANGNQRFFDLSGDGRVGQSDVDHLVRVVLHTEYGDANLDGFVNELDGYLVTGRLFTNLTGWATGDFNGDRVTDGSDLNIWNQYKRPTVFMRYTIDFAGLPGADGIPGTTDDVAFTPSDHTGRTIDDEFMSLGVRFQGAYRLGLFTGGYLPNGTANPNHNSVLTSVVQNASLRPITIDFSYPQTTVTLDMFGYVDLPGTTVPITLRANGNVISQRILTNADAVLGGISPFELGGRFQLTSAIPFNQLEIGLTSPDDGGVGIDNLTFSGPSPSQRASDAQTNRIPTRRSPKAPAPVVPPVEFASITEGRRLPILDDWHAQRLDDRYSHRSQKTAWMRLKSIMRRSQATVSSAKVDNFFLERAAAFAEFGTD